VQVPGHRGSFTATVVAANTAGDLALLRLQGLSGLPVAKFAATSTVHVGDAVLAVGNAEGYGGTPTVTEGIVSAIRAPLEETPQGTIDLLGGAIQTDAAINPGNSGGPLFNEQGQVIGVNAQIATETGGYQGIGFAIPSNVVKRVAPELIQRGCYAHPYIGISTIALSQIGQQVKQQAGIPTNQSGLLVQSVEAGAAQAGLQAGGRTINAGGGQLRVGGDIIVGIDGRNVTAGGDLRAYVENNRRVGDTVTLTVLRNGQRQDVQVRLSQRPNQQC
jgi:2-alkenal reductase